MMNIWRKGSIHQNPYYRSAFRICRVPGEMTRHRTLVRTIGRTRKIVKTAPERHQINGEAVSDAELNAAEEILLDPQQRMAEELLYHATENPPLKRLKQLAAEAAGAMGGEEPLEITDFSWLNAWAAILCERFLVEQPLTEIAFGPLALRMAPPFGPRDEK
jgi:hypothetical protein